MNIRVPARKHQVGELSIKVGSGGRISRRKRLRNKELPEPRYRDRSIARYRHPSAPAVDDSNIDQTAIGSAGAGVALGCARFPAAGGVRRVVQPALANLILVNFISTDRSGRECGSKATLALRGVPRVTRRVNCGPIG